MVCLGLEPREAGWKAQKNPLSYGCIPVILVVALFIFAIYVIILDVSAAHVNVNFVIVSVDFLCRYSSC